MQQVQLNKKVGTPYKNIDSASTDLPYNDISTYKNIRMNEAPQINNRKGSVNNNILLE